MDSGGRPPGAIALIGIACRFPGADDAAAFWRNLRQGVESITFFTDEELLAAGVEPALLGHLNYVKAAPVLKDVDKFDAAFFGYSPREATVTDPQQRLFLEVAWEAFEEAGYHPESVPGVVGVFAGGGGIVTNYLVAHPHHPAFAGDTAQLPYIGNDKDFLATRVSYKLNLTGPSVTVQTACSTSMVAVHLACQSLLSGESDMVLAGAATVRVPHTRGYLAEPGNVHSLDGHCRAFDADGKGAVFGSGVAAVLLRRLDDALDAGDHIHAVIKGTSITNDGARKLSFTAPSVTGQARAMVEALTLADVAPDSIGYVECHAAGTAVGDPLEIQALTRAFRTATARTGFCAVGSVKTNIGHPEQAAGLAGLIKTAFALEHREIPPSLHFVAPNPAIDFAASPFFVNTQLRDWTTQSQPRRAAVNSLGIGGTNAFAVLEETPTLTPVPKDVTRALHALTLSAKSEEALSAYVERFRAFLHCHPDADVADLCYTSNVSRSQFEHRLAVIGASAGELEAKLDRIAAQRSSHSGKPRHDGVAFLFTGQGAQHPGMAAELYQAHPAFREVLDRCDEAFRSHLRRPLLEVIFARESPSLLDQTAYTQPALFALEYGLAQFWQSLGVVPRAVMGHSLGEVVAACVAGAMEFDDAVRLVAARARLMQDLPERGAMVTVFAPEDAVRRALPIGDSVVIAAANSPQNTVVSGVREQVHALIERLTAQGVESRLLGVANGFHSPLVEPMLDALEEAAGAVAWSKPRIAFVSNLTGRPIEGPLGPRYWRDHARHAVRFADGVRALDGLGCSVFLELGPGSTLLGIASQVLTKPGLAWVPSLSRKKPDWQVMLEGIQRLYLEGLPIHWEAVHRGSLRRRLSLPTYPFQRKRFWVEDLPADPARPSPTPALPAHREAPEQTKSRDHFSEWLYRMQWEERPRAATAFTVARPGSWLVLSDASGAGKALAEALAAQGDRCHIVFAGDTFRRTRSRRWTVNPRRLEDFRRLVREVGAEAALPLRGAIHLWALDAPSLDGASAARLDAAEASVARGAILLSRALDEAHTSSAFSGRLYFVTRNAQAVTASDPPSEAVQALLWGLGRTLALERRELWGGLVDLPAGVEAAPEDIEALGLDLREPDAEDQVAYRDGRRFGARLVRAGPAVGAPAPVFRPDATYLITGGLGMIGLETARWLVKRKGVRSLVLAGRSGARRAAQRAVGELRDVGARVEVVSADVSVEADVRRLMKRTSGMAPLRGVIHGAGVLDNTIVGQMDWRKFARVTKPKVKGAWLLHRYTRDLDFFVLHSSVLSLIGSAGQGNYTAANAFLDALGSHRRALGLPATVINWTAWDRAGLASTAGPSNVEMWRAMGLRYLSPDDGMRVFERLMHPPVGQAAVAIADWSKYVQQFPHPPRFYASLLPEAPSPSPVPALDVRTRLGKTAGADRRAVLVDAIRQEVAEQMGFEQPVDGRVPLSELGLDSLMAANVASRLSATLGIPVPVAKLIRGPSIEQFVDDIGPGLDGLEASDGTGPAARRAPGPVVEVSTSRTAGDGWLVFPRPNPSARTRLFCFPYAGGNAATYRPWAESLRPDVELVAVEPPGRANRVHEAAIDDLDAFFESLRPALAPYLDKPAAFYGHCLGGITLFETASRLRDDRAVDLRHIFVSSARPPRRLLRVGRFEERLLARLLKLPKFDPLVHPYEQTDEIFAELIRHFNIGASEEFLASRELRQLLMPAIRAEFRMASRYRFRAEPPWDVGITCFVGTDDPYVTREDALAWAEHTRTDFRLHLREGDHFLVVDDRAFILDAINRELAA